MRIVREDYTLIFLLTHQKMIEVHTITLGLNIGSKYSVKSTLS